MTTTLHEPVRGGRFRASGQPTCPSCGADIAVDAQLCPVCGFTGSQTMDLFQDSPPPLLPVLDAAGIWTEAEIQAIKAAGEKNSRRYPQLKFHVCSVLLPAEVNLAVFGFWLLNVCPLDAGETREDRAWAVLLVINARTGRAAVIPGYSVEHWLGDRDWVQALDAMSPAWVSGKAAAAVMRFFAATTGLLDRVWKSRIARKSGKYRRSRRVRPLKP